ncbi:endothelin-converting enzyme homolog isoform X2 [Procambarus clarkii]|uniref:endothelin-converting enzyme homolog isoform X2 n=1 Tax=Procambarus clarkii TaxID=6728 RepID=UPI001E6789CA|nr:endothelin-converting enzyme homolog isoform X3 [Procambarus clarkii]
MVKMWPLFFTRPTPGTSEMTRYKQQTDVDDDTSSVGSARTEELPTGTTTVHYHMGSHWWRSRTSLEKALLVGWILQLVVVTILVAVLHVQTKFKPTLHMLLSHPHNSSPGEVCLTPDCVILSGSLLNSMDSKVDPCDNFYDYACGGWVSKNPIPEGKPIWGTLNKLASDNQIIMHNVLESTEKTESKAEEKARVFYRSCMDVNKTIEKLGGKPVLQLIEQMGGWSITGNWSASNYSLEDDVIKSKVDFNSEALFSWVVAENDKNSSSHILQFDQGGLTLPARNHYLNESEKAVVDAYIEYITKVGVLLGGEEDATRQAATGILSIEHQLATITAPDDERRDDDKLYHLMKIDDLNKLAPFMDWGTFINSAFNKINKHLSGSEDVVVYAPDFLKNLAKILDNTIATEEGVINVHNYLVWQVVRNYVGFLSQEFREAAKVLEKAQMGVIGTEESWRECVVATDAALGPAVGAMYIRKAFHTDSKNMAEEMIKRVRKTFKENLESVHWMDKKTLKAAIDKASSISEMIGFPDYILNKAELDAKFTDLKIKENDFFQNNVRVNNFIVKENLARLFKPVNKTRWEMSPPTVNAYYSPTRNNIVFPAGILQAPFFHQGNPKSLNYGAVGVVMGHELAHAFDDQGRKYDKEGNLDQWWQQETSDKFKNLTQCMVDQYSAYSLRGENLNGKLTLGENIADNGGLKASFRAYQEWVNENEEEKALPGISLTHQQLFFLGFSQVWCSSITKEAAHLEIMKDSHVPGEFRVFGSLTNSPDFATAFNCPVGSKMNPKKKCTVW